MRTQLSKSEVQSVIVAQSLQLLDKVTESSEDLPQTLTPLARFPGQIHWLCLKTPVPSKPIRLLQAHSSRATFQEREELQDQDQDQDQEPDQWVLGVVRGPNSHMEPTIYQPKIAVEYQAVDIVQVFFLPWATSVSQTLGQMTSIKTFALRLLRQRHMRAPSP